MRMEYYKLWKIVRETKNNLKIVRYVSKPMCLRVLTWCFAEPSLAAWFNQVRNTQGKAARCTPGAKPYWSRGDCYHTFIHDISLLTFPWVDQLMACWWSGFKFSWMSSGIYLRKETNARRVTAEVSQLASENRRPLGESLKLWGLWCLQETSY